MKWIPVKERLPASVPNYFQFGNSCGWTEYGRETDEKLGEVRRGH